MEITKDNFAEVLPQFKEAVDNCSFLSIDTEFTGLTSSKSYSSDRLDDLGERWDKLRDAGQKFLPIQVGVACFQWEGNKSAYVSREFNFYVFPRPVNRDQDARFMVQASCLAFLAEHNFDFNKWIHKGIGYVSLDQEAKMKGEIKRQRERVNSADQKIKLKRDNDIKFVQEMMGRVTSWKSSGASHDPIVLDPCNAFLRRALREALEGFFEDVYVDSVPGTGFHSCIRVQVASGAEADRLKSEAEEKRVKEVDDAVGFTLAVKYISASGKPVVGHNCLLDLVYSYGQYCGPLPERFQDFKRSMKTFLPQIYDTKFIADNSFPEGTFAQTDLESMYRSVTECDSTVRVEHGEGFDRYVNDESLAHEAAYDAYMTGVVFANLLQRSEMKGVVNGDNASVASSTRSVTRSQAKRMRKEPQLDAIKENENKVFLMHSDYGHVNFNGADAVPERKNVLALAPVPPNMNIPAIKGVFDRFGYTQTHVKWVDPSTAYVILNDANIDDVSVTKIVNQCRAVNLNVMKYYDYMNGLIQHEVAVTAESHYQQNPRGWSRCEIS